MHALLESILHFDKPVTINQMAEKFKVSGKTIRNDLSSANTILTEYGLTLIKKPGIGMFIQGEEKEKQKFLNYVKSKEVRVLPTEERQNKLLIRLLSSDCLILIKELSQDYYVSRSTITKDLDKLNKRLLPYELQIRNIKTYGLIIEGNEKEKRKLLSELFPVKLEIDTLEEKKICWIL
ncbi:helix-turn-helix domain-containing protein [Alkalibacterium sp. 20]|uniref:BglG family transcription antiterminator n=1 Tax=Alkalibacterium sp. 20 TaxID=1798803 RepID=UPI0009003574|nr:helix-turn-helix domain-containing protein [Alkalibacterium sp. 20]OJF90047.1 hypothetical protein AX762_11970 [Alkalibacterium sp. 20]